MVTITFYKPHTCLCGPAEAGEESCSKNPSQTCISSSSGTAAAVIRSDSKHRTSISTKMLVKMLRGDYEKEGKRWTEKDVGERIYALTQLRKRHINASVIRMLRAPSIISEDMHIQCIQGLASMLVKKGFGVVLHYAHADSVRKQIIDIAR